MFDLRAWLRRIPKPRKLRLKVDGEERIVDLGEGQKRWLEIESTVRASGASSCECLDANGAILRSTQLSDDEREAASDDEAKSKAEDRMLNKDRKEIAAILHAQGQAIERAYAAGADAAGKSADKLLELVETLTSSLSLAITNLHNVSANFAAHVVSQASLAGGNGEGGIDNSRLLAQVLSQAMGGAPAAPANGGKK